MRKVIGNKFRISVEVYDVAGEYPKDPEALKFYMDVLPYAAPTVPPYHKIEYEFGVDAQLVKDDTGQYHVDVAPDETGTWGYRWQTEEITPPHILFAEEGTIDVIESKLA